MHKPGYGDLGVQQATYRVTTGDPHATEAHEERQAGESNDEAKHSSEGQGDKRKRRRTPHQQHLNKLCQQRYRERQRLRTLEVSQLLEMCEKKTSECERVQKDNERLRTEHARLEAIAKSQRASIERIQRSINGPEGNSSSGLQVDASQDPLSGWSPPSPLGSPDGSLPPANALSGGGPLCGPLGPGRGPCYPDAPTQASVGGIGSVNTSCRPPPPLGWGQTTDCMPPLTSSISSPTIPHGDAVVGGSPGVDEMMGRLTRASSMPQLGSWDADVEENRQMVELLRSLGVCAPSPTARGGAGQFVGDAARQGLVFGNPPAGLGCQGDTSRLPAAMDAQIKTLAGILRANSISVGGDPTSYEAVCEIGFALSSILELIGRMMTFSQSRVLDRSQTLQTGLNGEEMAKWSKCVGLMNLSGAQKQAISDLRMEQQSGIQKLRDESHRLNGQVQDALRASGDHPTVLSSVLKLIRCQQERAYLQEHQLVMDGLRALMLRILDPVQASILAVEAHPDRVDVLKLGTALATVGGSSSPCTGGTETPSSSVFLRENANWPA